MNTFEINKELNHLSCFIGTFPIDMLPKFEIKNKPFALVLNLDPSHLPGSHWTALFVDSKRNAFYLDSFGFPNFSIEFYNFLIKNKIRSLMYNKFHLQDIKSSACGAYCVLYIKMCCNGFSFKEFIKLFSMNTIYNDLIAYKILE